MKTKSLTVLLLGALLIYGCGSGSSSGSSSGGGEVTEVNSVNDIPEEVIDPREYDLTTSSTASAMIVSKGLKADEAASGFSRAGCETNRMKKNIIRSAIMPQMILCHVKAFEAASDIEIGTSFSYFRLPQEGEEPEAEIASKQEGPGGEGEGPEGEGGEGPPGVENFDPRVAIKKVGGTLTFVMCNGVDKAMELVISTDNDVYSGHVVDKWGDGFNGYMVFNADGTPDNFTTASFTQSFVEDSDFWSGFGSETLLATPSYNTVYGFYNESGEHSFAGGVYAMFDIDEGTAKFRTDSGSYPAPTVEEAFAGCEEWEGEGNCGDLEEDWLNGWLLDCFPTGVDSSDRLCFQPDAECPLAAVENECSVNEGEGNTESFTIDATDPLNLLFAVAATSSYEADVLAATIPDSSAAPSIEFTSASAEIDCADSDSWDEFPFTSEPDTAECEAMEEELDDWDTGNPCEMEESEGDARDAID